MDGVSCNDPYATIGTTIIGILSLDFIAKAYFNKDGV